MYDYLFSPIRINQVEIKNRIAYPSLGLLFSYDRKLNDRYYNFFAEISEGGAGIVTVGPVGVDHIGSGLATLGLDNDDAIPAFKKLTGIIKKGGAKPWIQLFHGGAYVYPFLIDNKQPIAPSPIFSNYSKTEPREMTIQDINKVQEAFGTAAMRAKEAGFEGVEIIGSAGYLITQFLSPLKNQRKDEYGGSFENRVRFVQELLKLVRTRLGTDFPLTIRMAGNDFVEGSNTDSETGKIARVYEECGVDALNVTGGWHESRVPQLPMNLPRSGYAFLARNIKDAVSIPVMASNRISTPDQAENIIKDGYADMVNLGRVLIADPKWPQKAREGRPSEIRPCVACSQGCTDEIFSGRPVFCVGNPRAGFEGERKIEKTKNPKKILIAGAGAAGLEASVTATRMGHNVELFEKSSCIGGQLHLAGAPPHKQELLEYIRYYQAMLEKYKIPVTFNTEVTKELIEKKNPDHLIIAEGAEPLIPPIEGINDPQSRILSSWDVLKDNPLLGKKVAIIGGGSVGLETALCVASKGTLCPEMLHFLFTYEAMNIDRMRELMFDGTSKVTVFEMLPKAGKDVGKSTKWVLMGNLNRYGVKIRTKARVTSIKEGTLFYEIDDKEESEQFDNIIIASGSRSRQVLTKQIESLDISYTCIGDCIKPGRINDAIHRGFMAAITI